MSDDEKIDKVNQYQVNSLTGSAIGPVSHVGRPATPCPRARSPAGVGDDYLVAP